jgi:microcystin-dependent protein
MSNDNFNKGDWLDSCTVGNHTVPNTPNPKVPHGEAKTNSRSDKKYPGEHIHTIAEQWPGRKPNGWTETDENGNLIYWYEGDTYYVSIYVPDPNNPVELGSFVPWDGPAPADHNITLQINHSMFGKGRNGSKCNLVGYHTLSQPSGEVKDTVVVGCPGSPLWLQASTRPTAILADRPGVYEELAFLSDLQALWDEINDMKDDIEDLQNDLSDLKLQCDGHDITINRIDNDLSSHINDFNNPHHVTAGQLGLDLSQVPLGSGMLWFDDTPPYNYVFAEGQSLNKNEYLLLFNLFGYKYGGSGNDFNVPDMRGRIPLGYDPANQARGLGWKGGSETNTLTISQLPRHKHSIGQLPVNPTAMTHSHTATPTWHSIYPEIYVNGSPAGNVNCTARIRNFVVQSLNGGPALTLESPDIYHQFMVMDNPYEQHDVYSVKNSLDGVIDYTAAGADGFTLNLNHIHTLSVGISERSDSHGHTVSAHETSETGSGDTSFSILPPVTVCRFIIKAKSNATVNSYSLTETFAMLPNGSTEHGGTFSYGADGMTTPRGGAKGTLVAHKVIQYPDGYFAKFLKMPIQPIGRSWDMEFVMQVDHRQEQGVMKALGPSGVVFKYNQIELLSLLYNTLPESLGNADVVFGRNGDPNAHVEHVQDSYEGIPVTYKLMCIDGFIRMFMQRNGTMEPIGYLSQQYSAENANNIEFLAGSWYGDRTAAPGVQFKSFTLHVY